MLCALSGMLCAGAVSDSALSWLAWIAFVPLLIAIDTKGLFHSYILGLVAGLIGYGFAAYGYLDAFFFNLLGYQWKGRFLVGGVYIFYCAQLLAILGLCTTFTSNTKFLSWMGFPLSLTLLFSYFPTVLPFSFGVSQAYNSLVIQGVSYTGPMGLDLFIGLSNVLIFRLLKRRVSIRELTFVIPLLSIWFLIGVKASTDDMNVNEPPSTLSVGIVQPNQLAREAYVDSSKFDVFNPVVMSLSEQLASQQVDVIIWPETRYKRYYDSKFVYKRFNEAFDEFNSYTIFPDQNRPEVADEKMRNMLTVVSPEGVVIEARDKTKLIPFGERRPWFIKIPYVRDLADKYLANSFSEYLQGDEVRPFHLASKNESLEVLPLICYEALFPVSIASGFSNKQASRYIVVSSNNNWFNNSSVVDLHHKASILRAVESRSNLIHVMNNGPSKVILASGKVYYSTKHGESGAYVVRVPNSPVSALTFYSRYSVLIHCIFILGFLVTLLLSLRQRYLFDDLGRLSSNT